MRKCYLFASVEKFLLENREIQKEQHHATSTSSWGTNTEQGQITTVRIKKQEGQEGQKQHMER